MLNEFESLLLYSLVSKHMYLNFSLISWYDGDIYSIAIARLQILGSEDSIFKYQVKQQELDIFYWQM